MTVRSYGSVASDDDQVISEPEDLWPLSTSSPCSPNDMVWACFRNFLRGGSEVLLLQNELDDLKTAFLQQHLDLTDREPNMTSWCQKSFSWSTCVNEREQRRETSHMSAAHSGFWTVLISVQTLKQTFDCQQQKMQQGRSRHQLIVTWL